MYSRRHFLAGVGAGTLLGLSGCSGPLLGSGPAERPPSAVGSEWTPDAGTWATVGRDPRHGRTVAGSGPGPDPDVLARSPASGSAGGRRTVLAATPETLYVLAAPDDAAPSVRALGTDDWTERWRADISPGVTVAGLAAETLYAAGEGRVGAVDTGGDPRWRTDHHAALTETVGDEWLEDSPSLFGPRAVPTPDLLYAGSAYGFHGFDPADGTESWRVVFPDAPRSVPQSVTVTDDAVWTVADRTLLRLATPDGSATTTAAELPVGVVHPPAAGPAGVLIAPRGGATRPPYTVAAYGPNDLGPADDSPAPAPAWRVRLHPDVTAEVYGVTAPAVTDDRVVVAEAVATAGEQQAAVAALDPTSGERLWRTALPVADTTAVTAATGRLLSDPAVVDGTVLVGVGARATAAEQLVPNPGVVLALDAATGEEQWRVAPDVAPRELVVAGGYCCVADGEGRVAVLG